MDPNRTATYPSTGTSGSSSSATGSPRCPACRPSTPRSRRSPSTPTSRSLELPIVGAAPLPPAVRDAFEARTGIALCEGYGLTEGTCASARGWPHEPRPGTVGQRLPYQDVRAVAVDETTGEWTFLTTGEVGTIVLRGPNVFAGYLARGESGTELCADGKLRDGWLDTGDLGRRRRRGLPPPRRFVRILARTRTQLVAAAGAVFARQGVDNTRINEITEEADVGFGSFYNHFDSKEAIVEAVLADAIAAQGAAIEAMTAGLDDPAETVAVAHRYFVDLRRSDPDWAWLLIRLDLSHNIALAALGPFARRDLERGVKAGRFNVPDKRVALFASGGALLAVMRAVLDEGRAEDADIHHTAPAALGPALGRRPG